jgi:hypothetical protein
MRWPFKKTIEDNLIRSFETGLRMVQVSLYKKLTEQYLLSMPDESARVLAAQVVNYLRGEDLLGGDGKLTRTAQDGDRRNQATSSRKGRRSYA